MYDTVLFVTTCLYSAIQIYLPYVAMNIFVAKEEKREVNRH